MEALWYGVVSVMLAVYVVLDGFDLGAGALHLFVARQDSERRTVLAAIGPLWDGNEVWLLAGGGALVLAFPVAYAVGFSGFYLPLVLVLWLLVLRGVSIEVRSHVHNPLWRSFWDVVFAVGSTLLAVVLGAALGNVLRGVPLDESGSFSLGLFASWWPGPHSGVLDAYTVLVGVFTLVALSAHGALFLALKTEGPVQQRSARAARVLSLAVAVLLVVVSWATVRVQPALLEAALSRPLVWLTLLLTAVAIVGLAFGLLRARPAVAFGSSALLLVGLLASAAAASWPVLLHSSVSPRFDVTAHTAAAGAYALGVATVWAAFGLPLACAYFVYLARTFRGPARVEPETPAS
ncbi:MAG: cytochrome d ubiquinol oxidase subunit II [Myxococcaceae bacterium]